MTQKLNKIKRTLNCPNMYQLQWRLKRFKINWISIMKNKEKKIPMSNMKNNNITMKMGMRATTQSNIQILNPMGKVRRMKIKLIMIKNYSSNSSSNKMKVKNQINKKKFNIPLHHRLLHQQKLQVVNQSLNIIITIIITSVQSIIEVTFRIR